MSYIRGAAGVHNFASGRNAVADGSEGTFRIACLPGAGYLTKVNFIVKDGETRKLPDVVIIGTIQMNR